MEDFSYEESIRVNELMIHSRMKKLLTRDNSKFKMSAWKCCSHGSRQIIVYYYFFIQLGPLKWKYNSSRRLDLKAFWTDEKLVRHTREGSWNEVTI